LRFVIKISGNANGNQTKVRMKLGIIRLFKTSESSSFIHLFDDLSKKTLVNVRDNSTSGDSSLDQIVKLFVTSDSQLQVSWGDSLHLQVLAGVSCEFKHLCGQVL
jgi:hypothetical protein